MKKRFLIPLISVLVIVGGYTITGYNSKNVEKKMKWEKQQKSLATIYQTDDGQYSIYSSSLLDTYLIACALYFDFDSANMISPENILYQNVKEHFGPYKDHDFIRQLDKYIDVQYRDSKFEVLQALTTYDYLAQIENKQLTKFQNTTFISSEEVREFVSALLEFYRDTDAEVFFENNQSHQLKMIDKIQKEIANIAIDDLIKTMEGYVNNKDQYFAEDNIKYTSLITLYRPSGASFYQVEVEDSMYFVSYQSALQDKRNLESIEVGRIIETALHEYLHMYINPGVKQQKQLINQLAGEKEKMIYGGQLYQNMDWHRIVDENIVRAVETRIYGMMYNDFDRAYEEILRKEIEQGGFGKVYNIYTALEDYEANRALYNSIDEYLPGLIHRLFNEIDK